MRQKPFVFVAGGAVDGFLTTASLLDGGDSRVSVMECWDDAGLQTRWAQSSC